MESKSQCKPQNEHIMASIPLFLYALFQSGVIHPTSVQKGDCFFCFFAKALHLTLSLFHVPQNINSIGKLFFFFKLSRFVKPGTKKAPLATMLLMMYSVYILKLQLVKPDVINFDMLFFGPAIEFCSL